MGFWKKVSLAALVANQATAAVHRARAPQQEDQNNDIEGLSDIQNFNPESPNISDVPFGPGKVQDLASDAAGEGLKFFPHNSLEDIHGGLPKGSIGKRLNRFRRGSRFAKRGLPFGSDDGSLPIPGGNPLGMLDPSALGGQFEDAAGSAKKNVDAQQLKQQIESNAPNGHDMAQQIDGEAHDFAGQIDHVPTVNSRSLVLNGENSGQESSALSSDSLAEQGSGAFGGLSSGAAEKQGADALAGGASKMGFLKELPASGLGKSSPVGGDFLSNAAGAGDSAKSLSSLSSLGDLSGAAKPAAKATGDDAAGNDFVSENSSNEKSGIMYKNGADVVYEYNNEKFDNSADPDKPIEFIRRGWNPDFHAASLAPNIPVEDPVPDNLPEVPGEQDPENLATEAFMNFEKGFGEGGKVIKGHVPRNAAGDVQPKEVKSQFKAGKSEFAVSKPSHPAALDEDFTTRQSAPVTGSAPGASSKPHPGSHAKGSAGSSGKPPSASGPHASSQPKDPKAASPAAGLGGIDPTQFTGAASGIQSEVQNLAGMAGGLGTRGERDPQFEGLSRFSDAARDDEDQFRNAAQEFSNVAKNFNRIFDRSVNENPAGFDPSQFAQWAQEFSDLAESAFQQFSGVMPSSEQSPDLSKFESEGTDGANFAQWAEYAQQFRDAEQDAQKQIEQLRDEFKSQFGADSINRRDGGKDFGAKSFTSAGNKFADSLNNAKDSFDSLERQFAHKASDASTSLPQIPKRADNPASAFAESASQFATAFEKAAQEFEKFVEEMMKGEQSSPKESPKDAAESAKLNQESEEMVQQAKQMDVNLGTNGQDIASQMTKVADQIEKTGAKMSKDSGSGVQSRSDIGEQFSDLSVNYAEQFINAAKAAGSSFHGLGETAADTFAHFTGGGINFRARHRRNLHRRSPIGLLDGVTAGNAGSMVQRLDGAVPGAQMASLSRASAAGSWVALQPAADSSSVGVNCTGLSPGHADTIANQFRGSDLKAHCEVHGEGAGHEIMCSNLQEAAPDAAQAALKFGEGCALAGGKPEPAE